MRYSDLKGRVYNCKYAVDSEIEYEDRVIDGLVAMKIIHVIDTEKAIELFEQTHRHVLDTFSKVANELKAVLSAISEEITAPDFDSDELTKLLNEIISLTKHIREYEPKDADLVKKKEY